MTASYPLDEAGKARRDEWLRLFTTRQDVDAPPAHPADAVLEPTFRHFGGFWDASLAPFFAETYAVSGLERKTVELIATAALAVRGWETGVRAHARLALDAGATPDEVRGAILVVLGIGGITAVASGLAWAEPILQQFDADDRQRPSAD